MLRSTRVAIDETTLALNSPVGSPASGHELASLGTRAKDVESASCNNNGFHHAGIDIVRRCTIIHLQEQGLVSRTDKLWRSHHLLNNPEYCEDFVSRIRRKRMAIHPKPEEEIRPQSSGIPVL